jgi:hypothetical protein
LFFRKIYSNHGNKYTISHAYALAGFFFNYNLFALLVLLIPESIFKLSINLGSIPIALVIIIITNRINQKINERYKTHFQEVRKCAKLLTRINHSKALAILILELIITSILIYARIMSS